MANLNTNTVALIGSLRKINTSLSKLIRIFQTIRDMLETTEQLLMISKRLSDKIDELYNALVAVNLALLALSNVPYVGPVAKVAQKIVAQIKKIVKQAKSKINNLEKKIKPHRKKIRKFREYINKILNPLIAIHSFLKKEEQFLSASHEMTNSLPKSRYKNLSLERLNASSETLNTILAVPLQIVSKANHMLDAVNPLITEIDRLCKLIEPVIRPVMLMLKELERVEKVTKEVSEVLEQSISVDVGVTKITLSVKDILSGPGNVPGLNKLTEQVTKILDPLLKSMGLKVKGVPGLDGGVGNLGKVLEKLNTVDSLKKKITDTIAGLTGDHKPQHTFKKIDAG